MATVHATTDQRQPVGRLAPAVQFAVALLRANLRNPKALAITLGMPLFMLFTIWVPAVAGDEESQELMQLLFPAVILLSVIMPGLTQATRLTRWREQRIFQRLALTPVPLVHLTASAAATQIAIGLAQGVFMLLFGIILVGLDMTWQHALLVLGAMALAGLAFVAFGSAIAAFSRKADFAGYVFFFTIMPLTFLASFPPEMMPEALNVFTPWLPTSMAIELIGPLFLNNQPGDGAVLAVLGLVAYTALFTGISAARFRWQS
jgi:ABC-type multidrug transport system permease subunit